MDGGDSFLVISSHGGSRVCSTCKHCGQAFDINQRRSTKIRVILGWSGDASYMQVGVKAELVTLQTVQDYTEYSLANESALWRASGLLGSHAASHLQFVLRSAAIPQDRYS